jgi:hypothetical protein
MQDLGKYLFAAGVVLALAGLWLWSGRGTGWLGRLPGDFSYQSGGVRVYFPLATCLLLSVVLTIVAWFWRR